MSRTKLGVGRKWCGEHGWLALTLHEKAPPDLCLGKDAVCQNIVSPLRFLDRLRNAAR